MALSFWHWLEEDDHSKAGGETMISGGNATVFVTDMERAVTFYTETLGMKLTNRFGNDWATVEAGKGLTIGLHPADAKYPAPGTKGAVMLGLEIDEPIDTMVERLTRKGVAFKGTVIRGTSGNFAHLEDPDGNEMYLWEVNRAVVTEPDVEYAGSEAR